MLLEWTAAALADTDEIVDFIFDDNPAAALAVEQLVWESANHLAAMPYLGRLGRVEIPVNLFSIRIILSPTSWRGIRSESSGFCTAAENIRLEKARIAAGFCYIHNTQLGAAAVPLLR